MSDRSSPPHSLEAEKSLLGAILVENNALYEVGDLIVPEDFYREVNATLFRVFLALSEEKLPIDLTTVRSRLQGDRSFEGSGGAVYLSEILQDVPTAANIRHYAKLVKEKSIVRRLISTAQDIARDGFGEIPQVEDFIAEAERKIFEVAQDKMRQPFRPIRDLIKEAFSSLEKRFEMRRLMRRDEVFVTGVSTGFESLDRLTAGLQKGDMVILAARPSMGKCLTAHTVIDDPETGRRLTIEECVKRRLPHVYNLSSAGELRVAKIADWVDSGVQPCFGVKTRTGREVEVTGHHPFLGIKGWVPLSQLAVGDFIAVPREVPVFGSDKLGSKLRLLAYFIAEGGLSSHTPKFTNTDPELVSDFIALIAEHFPQCSVRRYNIDYSVVTPRSGGKPNPTTEWLRAVGLWGKKSEAKSFPPLLWEQSRESLSEFLKVLFSCDGTIYSMSGYPRIEFTVASEVLAHDVHHALTRFGIIAKLWRKTERSWRVEITEPESVTTYQTQIGWLGEKSRRFAYEEAPQRRSNCGSAPPAAWDLVRGACEEKGLSLSALARLCGETEKQGKFAGFNPHTQRGIARDRLARYAAVLEDERLQLASSRSVYWDEILEITPIGEQQVYDLSVPDGENFVAQDIFVHNTALALNIAQNAALKKNVGVLVCSLEMGATQLVERLLASEARINASRMRVGELAPDDFTKLMNVASRVQKSPLYIDDTAALSVTEVRAKARRLASEQPLGLILIDYLQLMRGRPSAAKEGREREISDISRGLKALAKELEVPVVALSQLNRSLEQRADKRPQLSDLRESGALEQDADVIMFIYRDEYYNKDTPDQGIAEVIIAKQRNGPTDTVRLKFFSEFTRFDNLIEENTGGAATTTTRGDAEEDSPF